nr:hypothetical protein [Tanacetum cinerariifolium]
EPPLAPNPPKLKNYYLDALDYDDEEELYENLDEDEEDPKKDLEMDIDEEEEDPEMNINDEQEEKPVPASSPFKGPLSTYEVGEPSSIASALIFSTRYELNQTEIAATHKVAIRARRWLDRVDPVIAAERTTIASKATEVVRAAAAVKITRAAATVDRAEGSNNAGPAMGAGGPNVAGPTVGAVAMNAVPELENIRTHQSSVSLDFEILIVGYEHVVMNCGSAGI